MLSSHVLAHSCRVGTSDAPSPTSTHLGSLMLAGCGAGYSAGYGGNLDDEDMAGRNAVLVQLSVAIEARLAGRWIHLREVH